MPPKQLKGKSISSFFLKPAATLVASPAATTASTEEDVSGNMAAIRDAERRLNSLMDQLEQTSSSSGTSVQTQKKRRDLNAPEFGVPAIQLKKTSKIGNIILSSIEETTLPIMSVRARDRGQKLLSSARKRNSEAATVERESLEEREPDAVGHFESPVVDDAFSTIGAVEVPIDVDAAEASTLIAIQKNSIAPGSQVRVRLVRVRGEVRIG
jgi:hypothetical protein